MVLAFDDFLLLYLYFDFLNYSAVLFCPFNLGGLAFLQCVSTLLSTVEIIYSMCGFLDMSLS